MSHDFEKLEKEINNVLEQSWQEIMNTPESVAYYSSIFDRTSETGFYSSGKGPKGEGEIPSWSPNEAYMQSADKIWESAITLLLEKGITVDKPLREHFKKTREYKDKTMQHRRVFFGQLCHQEVPITVFMLTFPHSHEKFDYPVAPHIQISRELP